MSESIFGKNKLFHNEEDEHWLSVSDLMAGLMIVFLFISIVLMRNALVERNKVKELSDTYQIERDKIKEVAKTYKDNKVNIYNALMTEFETDLVNWDAEIKKETLSINFKSPEVLFDSGKINLKPKFKEIISDFFPRYLTILNKFKNSIEEIRIEGHTSSQWNTLSADQAYFQNMNLSQGRTRSVLSHIYSLEAIHSERAWIRNHVAAVGYSSSKLILIDGIEDSAHSRRVIFRLITNSEEQILKILEG